MKFQFLCVLLTIFLLSSCANKPPQVINKVIRDTIIINKSTEERESVRMANPGKFKISTEYYPAAGQDERVRFLILHYTAIDLDTSIRVLTQQEVSSHYLIPEGYDNKIYQLVDESKRAWHAGVSYWKGINNVNFSSIGIEIVNLGNFQGEITDDVPDGRYFYNYPKQQIDKVGEISKDIVDRYKIDPVNVLGHSDVAPQRKPDPGPNFPWKRLYDEYGVGAWYEDVHVNMYLPNFPYDKIDTYSFILSVQNDFNKYGYEIQKTGEWDKQTENVIRAFQYHFRPDRHNGVLDAETWAILQALILKYRS